GAGVEDGADEADLARDELRVALVERRRGGRRAHERAVVTQASEQGLEHGGRARIPRGRHALRGRTRRYVSAIMPREKVSFFTSAKSRCGKPVGNSGIPAPRSTGTTPRYSSSTRSARRKLLASSPPPMSQMFLPGRARMPRTTAPGGRSVNVTPPRSPGAFDRDMTQYASDEPPNEPPIRRPA